MAYFLVWTVFGLVAFPLGVALAAIEMQQPALARAVPIGVGVVVLIAGALQFSAWKARPLARGIRVIEDGFESTAVCRSLVAHDFSPS